MRGGYRPGSGPAKGTIYRKRTHPLKNIPESDELTPEDREDIRLLLSFHERFKDGGTLTRTEIALLDEMVKKNTYKPTPDELRIRDKILESFAD
jgi:hypothetical protein